MFRDLFVNKSDRTTVHLLRSIFSSNLAFAVDFGILAFLTEAAGMHYLLSKIIAGSCVFFFNFYTCRRVLFR